MNNKNKVLRISTAGSVDDGKSTLIGRLLYDTHSLKKDKLEAIERSSRKKGYDYLDFSLATDGLVAEREQGITIDVAHIYFSTPRKSYIIADTPGHVEYTRNMVTGVSTSQVSIILVDARNGVVEQTKRHFYISNLLRLNRIIIAVNKMDMVNYDESVFASITSDFQSLIGNATYKKQRVSFVPISALYGDNVVEKSEKMPWYGGDPLLDILENIDMTELDENSEARFQVQTVIRPKTAEYHDFRGYAGKLKGGELSVGDEVIVLPAGTRSKIKTIEFYDEIYQTATKGSSVTITLEDDLDVSRGDLVVKVNELPREDKELVATVCWMDNQPLMSQKVYLLQHGVKIVKSKIAAIAHKLNIDTAETIADVDQLEMNDLGLVKIKLAQKLNFDSYADNKENGAFILIDAQTNNTAGVGFIE